MVLKQEAGGRRIEEGGGRREKGRRIEEGGGRREGGGFEEGGGRKEEGKRNTGYLLAAGPECSSLRIVQHIEMAESDKL